MTPDEAAFIIQNYTQQLKARYDWGVYDVTPGERQAMDDLDIQPAFHDYGAEQVLEAYRRGYTDGKAAR